MSNEVISELSRSKANSKVVAITSSFRKSVDEYVKKQRELTMKKRSFDASIRHLEQQVADLKEELLGIAEAREVTQLEGDEYTVDVLSSTRREVDPKEFFRFLRDRANKEMFWKYVTVPVTQAVRDYGEAVLEREGVVMAKTKPYSRLQVR